MAPSPENKPARRPTGASAGERDPHPILAASVALMFRYRWAYPVVLVSLLGAAAVLLPNTTINDAPERWTPRSIQKAWDEFSRHFPAGDTIAIAFVFERPPVEQDAVFLRDVAAKLRVLPHVRDVYDLTLVADQVELVPITRILNSPPGDHRFALYEGALFDRQRRTIMTYVELKPLHGPGRDEARRTTVQAIREIVGHQVPEGIRAHIVGGIVIQYHLEEMARKVLATTLPLASLLMLGTIYLVFRSWQAVLLCIVSSAASLAGLLVIVHLCDWHVDVVTMAAPALMVVLCLVTCVHISHHGPALANLPQDQRITRTANLVVLPCLGAAVTTAAGFAMLLFNELEPIRELGAQLAVGAFLAVLACFAAWTWIPVRDGAAARALTPRFFRKHVIAVTRTAGTWVTGFAVLFAILVMGIFRINVSTDPFSFVHPHDPIAVALRHLDEAGFGAYTLEICLVPRDGRRDPEDLVAVRQFVDALEHPQIVKRVSSLDFSIAAGPPSLRNLRRFHAFQSVFSGWLVDRTDEGAVRVTLMCRADEDGFQDLVTYVANRLPRDRFRCVLAGNVAQIAALANGLILGLARGLFTAALVIGVLCLVLFRSLRLGIAAFPPNVFPVVLALGLMGWFGIPLDSGTAMVATIALGIALSDTIHLLTHYQYRRIQGESSALARRDAVLATGRAVVVTSAVLTTGFLIFLTSPFKPLYHFGVLASVAMVGALAGDLILLVDLIDFVDGRGLVARLLRRYSSLRHQPAGAIRNASDSRNAASTIETTRRASS